MRIDTACKRLLSQRKVLAWILKECVSEFKAVSLETIEQECIQDIALEKPMTKIHGMRNEDNGSTEETIYYDIRFMAKLGNDQEAISLMINIEAQGNMYPGYPLIKRGLYYCCRMISGQYGTVFEKSNYEEIKKVYSIWILLNPPQYKENAVMAYEITERSMVGNMQEKQEHYDLICAMILYLTKDINESHGIIKMLSILLSKDIATKEKEQMLANEFSLQLRAEIKEEEETMCNLGESIWQEGIAEGKKQGREQGRKQGRKEGLKQGKLEGEKMGRQETALEVAKRMIAAKKYELEEIIAISGLSAHEIKQLQM